LDIKIKADNNIRFKSNVADAEMKCDFGLTGTPYEPRLMGQIEVIKGRFNFKDNEFKINVGKAEFHKFNGTSPRLRLEAETRIGEVKIYLSVEGYYLEGLKLEEVKFSSLPPLSEGDIYSLLTLGRRREDITIKSAGDILSQEVASTLVDYFFVGELEKEAAQAFKLDTVRLKGDILGLNGEEGTSLSLGKYLTPDLYINYSKSLTSEAFQILVEYRLKSDILLSAEVSENDNYKLRIEQRLSPSSLVGGHIIIGEDETLFGVGFRIRF
jgi:autotransporter translocation and assembly factor TamB